MAIKGLHARRKIVELLEKEQVASFTEIKAYINSKLKYGITTGRLNNILSKDPIFVKVGKVQRQAYYREDDGNGYIVTEWALAN